MKIRKKKTKGWKKKKVYSVHRVRHDNKLGDRISIFFPTKTRAKRFHEGYRRKRPMSKYRVVERTRYIKRGR